MKTKKIFTQIFPSYLTLILIIIVFFAGYEQKILKDFYAAEIRQDLSARARLISEHVRDYFNAPDAVRDSVVHMLRQSGQVRITIIRNSGQVIADSHKDKNKMDNHADRPEIKHAFKDAVGHSVRYSYTLQKQLIYLAVPLKIKNKIVGAVRVAFPLSSYESSIDSLQKRVLVGGLFILLLGALFSYFISRRISKPLEEIKQGAQRFAAGVFEPPLPERGSSEITALAATLNQMAREINARIQTISLQRSEQEAMFASMKEGVLAVDKNERIIRVNKAAVQFFNVLTENPEKRLIHEAIRHSAVLDFIRDALKQNKHLEQDISIRSEMQHILRISSDPLQNSEGQIIGALILINEITQLKKLDKMRQDFVANVSHELKTPITSIKGYMETLREGQVEDPQTIAKFHAIVARQADRMNAIVTDLLQLSHIEQQEGSSKLIKNKEALSAIIHNAVEDCQKLADENKITIQTDADKEIPVFANRALLEQALINLINNALKYSEPGSEVQIRAEQKEDELRIHVQDQGCGIDPKYHERLFERFFRVDKARSRELGGTGLGLAIVKHIAKVHGGKISVSSNVGTGSTFTIHLPL